jgi:cytochrome c-type biogenesis protein CcmH
MSHRESERDHRSLLDGESVRVRGSLRECGRLSDRGCLRERGRAALQRRVSGLRLTWASAPVAVFAGLFPRAPERSRSLPRKTAQGAMLCLALFALLGAGDPGARFSEIGHQLMCVCGCHQILLECNHVGCPESDGMRNELMASLTRGDSDSLVQQAFVQKYGPTVLAAPLTTGFGRTAWIVPFVALGLGIIAVVTVVRAWKNRPAPAIADGLRPVQGAERDQFREQADKETEL